MNEKCYTFKGQVWEAQSWEMAIMYISDYMWHYFTKMQSQNDEAQNIKFRVKGIDPIWSQICSSLSQTFLPLEQQLVISSSS